MRKHKLSETCGMSSNLRNFVAATTIDWKCTGQGINFMNKVNLSRSVAQCAVTQTGQLIAGSRFESQQLATLILYYLFIDSRNLELYR